MSVVVTAVMHPTAGREEEAVAAIAGTIAGIHAEPGCELYAVHRTEEGGIVLVERWASREHLDAHLAGEAIAALRAALAGLMDAPSDLTVLTPVPLGDPTRGAL